MFSLLSKNQKTKAKKKQSKKQKFSFVYFAIEKSLKNQVRRISDRSEMFAK